MNKKTIQIIIIVVSFSGSGYLLYKQFKPASVPQNSVVGAVGSLPGNGKTQEKIDKILPRGGTLDFKILERPGVVYGNTQTKPVQIQNSDFGVDKYDLLEVVVDETRQ